MSFETLTGKKELKRIAYYIAKLTAFEKAAIYILLRVQFND